MINYTNFPDIETFAQYDVAIARIISDITTFCYILIKSYWFTVVCKFVKISHFKKYHSLIFNIISIQILKIVEYIFVKRVI